MTQPELPNGLILAGIPGPGVERAQELLTTMAGTLAMVDKNGTLFTPEAGAHALRKKSGSHLLIIYPGPEHALAVAMEGGQPPSQCLAAWREQIEQVLKACRGNRRYTTLINAQAALAAPAELGRLLAQRTGAPLHPVQHADGAEAPAPGPMPTLVAAYSLVTTSDLRPLLNELAASSIQPESAVQPDHLANAAYKTLMQREGQRQDDTKEELQQLQSSLKEAQEENDLILNQLFKVQEELEKYYIENNDLKEKMSQRQEEVERYFSENKKLKEDIRKRQTEIQNKNEKLHRFSQEKKQLKAKLDQLRNSRSWKITAPLRAVRGNARKQAGKQEG